MATMPPSLPMARFNFDVFLLVCYSLCIMCMILNMFVKN
jgi:hypothetical protein